jgi:hypothetical protein
VVGHTLQQVCGGPVLGQPLPAGRGEPLQQVRFWAPGRGSCDPALVGL